MRDRSKRKPLSLIRIEIIKEGEHVQEGIADYHRVVVFGYNRFLHYDSKYNDTQQC
jgi:hypothetical protein